MPSGPGRKLWIWSSSSSTRIDLPGAPRFLISEAVREGAYLRTARVALHAPYHDLAELALRDIVVRAILKEMAGTNSNIVYLDLTHLD